MAGATALLDSDRGLSIHVAPLVSTTTPTSTGGHQRILERGRATID